MPKVLITTVPFGDKNDYPIELLEKAGIEYLINPIGRKLSEDELAEMVQDFDAIIAGTEPITDKVMQRGTNLKLISRVGIGLDSVDLLSAEKRGIIVSYTPDAPAPAVAEITVGIALSLIRNVHVSNYQMHKGNWNRYFGKRISEITIGIIGYGRIGSGFLERLVGFSPFKVLVNDIKTIDLSNFPFASKATKEEIYKNCDLISIHVPLTSSTKNMIKYETLKFMKSDACVINTSRGGIINEADLYKVLKEGHLFGAAIDVFENEPYNGKLKELENCLLTSHMGSMSIDCRTSMEIEATKEVVRFFSKEPLVSIVPDEEYQVQREKI